ncbi:unnamed protein product [Protopolystoma xenopodis]|uniref:Uncharacterized protein n=1 Tax=Protopolystoma xenopodis TaxID=117903 RepID=A0A3S5ASR0_9PLAT|nr:unnamed protein product [Protopolystoma xenopodis]
MDHWEQLVQSGKVRDMIQKGRVLEIPRFADKVVKEAIKHKFPGPGSYDSKSLFELAPKKRNFDGHEIENPPFNVQEKVHETPPLLCITRILNSSLYQAAKLL